MEEHSLKRLRAATAAAWWTILIFAIYMTVGWGFILLLLTRRPEWVIKAWGGGTLTWDEMHRIILWTYGVLKLVLLAGVMITLWLTLYTRRLGRQA